MEVQTENETAEEGEGDFEGLRAACLSQGNA
jgi:hypothetical protein